MKLIAISCKEKCVMNKNSIFLPVIIEIKKSILLSNNVFILELIEKSYHDFLFFRIPDDINIIDDTNKYYLSIHKDNKIVTNEMMLEHYKEVIKLKRNDKINEILNNKQKS